MSDPDANDGGQPTRTSDASEDGERAPTVAVLREGTHGMPVGSYAAALRERLPDATVRLARTPGEEGAVVADAPVVTAPRIDEDLLDAAGELELFACMYAGADHLPLAELRERAVAVTTASGVHAPNAAEHAVGAILAFSRRFHVGRRQGDRGVWRHYHTDELRGSRVAVVGLGAIGTAVCERLDAFGVERVAVRHTPAKGGPAEEVLGYDAVHDALAGADHLVLTCPLTDLTRGLVDRDAIRTLPDDAHVVNLARGPVVDTDALVEALHRNHLGGATLDVTDPEPLPEDHPLWSFDAVRITPHNAGHTPRYYERLADVVAGNVRELAAGGIDFENRVA